jgi:hypothetical protein
MLPDQRILALASTLGHADPTIVLALKDGTYTPERIPQRPREKACVCERGKAVEELKKGNS